MGEGLHAWVRGGCSGGGAACMGIRGGCSGGGAACMGKGWVQWGRGCMHG